MKLFYLLIILPKQHQNEYKYLTTFEYVMNNVSVFIQITLVRHWSCLKRINI